MTQYVNGQPVPDEKPLPRAELKWVGKVLLRPSGRYTCIKIKNGKFGWVPFIRGGK